MTVVGLNHFNITAPSELIEDVRDFYVEVLGLTVGDRPNFARRGYWLYSGGKPIVHLVVSVEKDVRTNGGSNPSFVDHVAFSCKGPSEFIARLKALGIAYDVAEVSSRKQVQVFIRDPVGVGVEMNFEE
jgi:catechol 2,3-dioxygenase-like lactoylglutathione lyase family enzyme